MSEFTVFHDDGTKPIFEQFDTREEAEARVMALAVQGWFAIITQDHT